MTREFLFTLGGFHIWSVLELDSSWRQTKRRAAVEGEEKKNNTDKKTQHTAQHRFPSCHLSSVLSVQSRLGVKLGEGSDKHTEQAGKERVN